MKATVRVANNVWTCYIPVASNFVIIRAICDYAEVVLRTERVRINVWCGNDIWSNASRCCRLFACNIWCSCQSGIGVNELVNSNIVDSPVAESG